MEQQKYFQGNPPLGLHINFDFLNVIQAKTSMQPYLILFFLFELYIFLFF